MKTIFFNSPIGTEKLQFTVSDKPVDKLKDDGIIPQKAVTVSYPLIDENSSMELRALTSFPDRVLFDNINNPKKVIIDIELMNSFWLSETKDARLQCLKVLDVMQMRALLSNKTELLEEIEKDKQKLRDIPDKINFNEVKTISDIFNVIPLLDIQPEMYEYKYEAALK